MSRRLRVALYHDVDEDRLFGVRLYAAHVRAAIAGRCEVLDVHPVPRALTFRAAAATWLMKRVVYPRQVRGVAADVHHVLDQSHADLLDALPPRATIVTCHDLFALRHGPGWRRSLARRRLEKLGRAARVITVSEASAAAARDRLGIPADRVVVVRDRLDRFFLEPPAPEETAEAVRRLGLADGPFCLHVGASFAYKNLEGVIGALGRLGRPLALVKVGAPLTPAQRRLARERGVLVRELGERSRTELRALYHRGALLAYPSREEGFGWPVVEAMAAGLPVVASRIPALVEITAGAASLVPPDDTAALAEAIDAIVADPGLSRERAAAGRRRAEELAGGDFGADLLAVYESVAPCAS